MPKRWPLHPQPMRYEILESYVQRLARCYGVSHEQFCYRALGIPREDREARYWNNPTDQVLDRLSDGTGVSVEQLKTMTYPNVWKRVAEEFNRYANTPEGKKELQRLFPHIQ